MVRVALTTHWDWVMDHYWIPIGRGLRDAGHDVTLVTPDGPHADGFRDEGFRWIEWQVTRRSVNPLREAPAIARLAQIYRRGRFDAVQHFTIKPNVYGTIAARTARVPVVINTFSGLGFVFSDASRAMSIRRLLVPVMRRVFDRDTVWVVSSNDPDLEQLRELGVADPHRSRTIPEGVDTERFRPQAEPPEATGPVSVFLACRLVRDKGIAELVEAAWILEQRGVDVRIRIAGEPDVGNPETVTEEELAAWREEGAVEFLGRREDVPELLAGSEIAALPSNYREGFPRFLLEAAATGLPLISTDIPGSRVIVREGENGVLIPKRDARALADAIEELARDRDRRERFGEASRRIAAEEFSEQRLVERHLDVYRKTGVIR